MISRDANQSDNLLRLTPVGAAGGSSWTCWMQFCVGVMVRSKGKSVVDVDNEEQVDLWRKESRNPRQLSVRLVLDDCSTRPAVLLYWPIRP
jgi:hypothetical protein